MNRVKAGAGAASLAAGASLLLAIVAAGCAPKVAAGALGAGEQGGGGAGASSSGWSGGSGGRGAGGGPEGLAVPPAVAWRRVFHGKGGDPLVQGLAVDAAGNVALAGMFRGEVDLGPRPLVSAGDADALVAKLDPEGNVLWARSFGGPQTEAAYAVAFDAAGAVVVAGYAEGSLDLGDGPLDGPGFVAKLSSDGALLWSRGLGASGPAVASSLAVDREGFIAVAGVTWAGESNGAPPAPGAGSGAIHVALLEPGGAPRWTGEVAGQGVSWLPHVTAAGLEILLLGSFTGTVDAFGTSLSAKGDENALLFARFDHEGVPRGVRRLHGTGNALAGGLTTGPSREPIVTGTFSGKLAFVDAPLESGGASGNLFLGDLGAKKKAWSRAVADDQGAMGTSVVVTTDALRVVGGTLAGSSHADLAVLAFDALGEPRWRVDLGEAAPSGAAFVGADFAGNVLVTGNLAGGSGAGLLVAKLSRQP